MMVAATIAVAAAGHRARHVAVYEAIIVVAATVSAIASATVTVTITDTSTDAETDTKAETGYTRLSTDKGAIPESADRARAFLIELYDAWNRPHDAARYRAQRRLASAHGPR